MVKAPLEYGFGWDFSCKKNTACFCWWGDQNKPSSKSLKHPGECFTLLVLRLLRKLYIDSPARFSCSTYVKKSTERMKMTSARFLRVQEPFLYSSDFNQIDYSTRSPYRVVFLQSFSDVWIAWKNLPAQEEWAKILRN